MPLSRRKRKRFQELELRDMTLSQLLREMKQLAGPEVNNNTLKAIWMHRLSQNMRATNYIATSIRS